MKEYLDAANVLELTAEEIKFFERTGASIDQSYRTNQNPLVTNGDNNMCVCIGRNLPLVSSRHFSACHPEHRVMGQVRCTMSWVTGKELTMSEM